MNITDFFDPQNEAGLLYDTLERSLPAFGPELALCGTIVLMLLVRVLGVRWISAFWFALAGSVAALFLAAPWLYLIGENPQELPRQELFTGLLVYDRLTVFFRGLLALFAVLFVIMTRISGIPDREDDADFYTLFLGATVGMCLMASANHLLTVFLAVEMASVPSYVLAGMLKGRRQSSEAALKYAVYGAGAAGVMLYGISLLAGVLGSLHLPTMSTQLALLLADASFDNRQMLLVLGGLMLMVGLAFKLSAVPFHFWCPDVFEGASAEVNAFLSVASKAAALGLLIRVAVGFAHPPSELTTPTTEHAVQASVVAAAQVENETTVFKTVAQETQPVEENAAAPVAESDRADGMIKVRRYISGLIALLAAVTCTFGNLAAYGQTNIKRLLAYSTIAHAGLMMMPVAAAIAILDSPGGAVEAEKVLAAVVVYICLYLFMNLGAFAAVAFLRNALRSEEIDDLGGLIRRAPFLVVSFSLILLSLLGLPPLSGFVAKFWVFASLVQPGQPMLMTLLVIAVLNTVLSLFYYLRVVKTMTLDPEPLDRPPVNVDSLSFVSQAGVFLAVLTVPVVGFGVFFDSLNELAKAATRTLLS